MNQGSSAPPTMNKECTPEQLAEVSYTIRRILGLKNIEFMIPLFLSCSKTESQDTKTILNGAVLESSEKIVKLEAELSTIFSTYNVVPDSINKEIWAMVRSQLETLKNDSPTQAPPIHSDDSVTSQPCAPDTTEPIESEQSEKVPASDSKTNSITELEEAKSEIKDLKGALCDKDDEILELRQKNQESENQYIQNLESKNSKILNLLDEKHDAELKTREKTEEIENLEAELEKAKKEILNLRKDNEWHKMDSHAADVELDLRKSQVINLEEKLEQKSSEFEKSELRRQHLEWKVDQKPMDYEKDLKELEEKRSNVAEIAEKFRSENRLLNEKLTASESQRQCWKEEVDQKSMNYKKDMSALAAELLESKELAQKLQRENEVLKYKLAAQRVDQNLKAKELASELQKSKVECHRLEEHVRLQDMEINTLSNEVQKLKIENELEKKKAYEITVTTAFDRSPKNVIEEDSSPHPTSSGSLEKVAENVQEFEGVSGDDQDSGDDSGDVKDFEEESGDGEDSEDSWLGCEFD